MDHALDELTEKEKQALRLIVLGHDAKSSANELGLSVHTINERLRTSRRKLGTTSSREAARLLFESEGGTYETLVDKGLGEADEANSDDIAGRAAVAPSRRIIAGVLIMIALLAGSLVFLTPFSAETSQDAPMQNTTPDEVVADVARDWLALIDQKDWLAAYNATGQAFRQQNGLDVWVDSASKVHGSLGPALSRELLTVRYLNAPPNGYREVTFVTRFKTRQRIIESVTLEKQNGVWKPVAIMIDEESQASGNGEPSVLMEVQSETLSILSKISHATGSGLWTRRI